MVGIRRNVMIKMWSPKYKNRPEIEAPGLLRFISAVSIFSIVGLLLYAVAITLTHTSFYPDWTTAVYVVALHFVLPFGAFFTISTNSPLSRPVVALYFTTLCTATIAGKGILGELQFDQIFKSVIAGTILAAVLSWLYFSPKMRYYYAAISNKPIPEDLIDREEELQVRSRLGPKASAAVVWFLDHMETIVLLGFMFLAVYAFIRTA